MPGASGRESEGVTIKKKKEEGWENICVRSRQPDHSLPNTKQDDNSTLPQQNRTSVSGGVPGHKGKDILSKLEGLKVS